MCAGLSCFVGPALWRSCWQEWGWAIQENPNQRESKETLVIAVDAESKALLDAMEAGPGAPLDAAVHTFVTAPGVKSWFDGGSTTEGGRFEQVEANSEESPDSLRHPFRDRRRGRMWNGQDAARGSSDTKDGMHQEFTDAHGGCTLRATTRCGQMLRAPPRAAAAPRWCTAWR